MSLRSVRVESWYSSGRRDLVRDFYIPCLNEAQDYDRAVGFFSSTIYALLSLSLVDFIERGGRMRLICSPHLAEADVEAIRRGLSARQQIDQSLCDDIRTLVTQEIGRIGVELLATLVFSRSLEVRIAYRPGHAGIFHSKVGIFRDERGDQLAFIGSANETAAALLTERNHESFVVFESWTGEADAGRVMHLSEYFESLWAGREDHLEVRDLPDVPAEEIFTYRNAGGVEAALEHARAFMTRTAPVAQRGFAPTPLYAHQSQVLASWEDASHAGIIKHATGAGKTITALEAIRRWTRSGRPSVVLVPSDLLTEQWLKEARRELQDIDPNILVVGGSHSSTSWEQSLPDFTRGDEYLGPRLVIATMQSASTPRFIAGVVGGEHLLIVADEVHRIGSRQCTSSATFGLFGPFVNGHLGGRLSLPAGPIVVPSLL